MSEQKLSPEAQSILPEAAYRVSVLFREEAGLSSISGNPSFIENRKAFWAETADKYRPFKEKINDLYRALDLSYEWWGFHRPIKKDPWSDVFNYVSDEDAKNLLRKLLIPRSVANLNLSRDHLPAAEVIESEEKTMLVELKQSPDQITLNSVVRAILVNDLRLELKAPPLLEWGSGMSVSEYQDCIFQLVNAGARVLLSGAKVPGGVISPKQAGEIADRLTKSVSFDLNYLLHPEFRAALKEIRLPFPMKKLRMVPLPPGEGPK